jgi:hypothetical protein
MYRGARRSEVASVGRPASGGGAPAYQGDGYGPEGHAVGGAAAPRTGRELFQQTAGRGGGLYARVDVVEPPAGMCVATPHQVWDLQFGAEVNTQFGVPFSVNVMRDVQGRVFDGVSSRPCDFPLVPAGSQVECIANTVDVQRGDKFAQAVCSRVDFPGGKAVPLDGWSLVGPKRGAGVPATSRYPWGDIFADVAVDILSSIPGAAVQLGTAALSGPAGVALNIGVNRFDEQADQIRQMEFRRVPMLYVPFGAPAGLRQTGSFSLPDEPR